MNYVSGFDRNQLRMISYNELVDKESMARIIDAFIDKLNLSNYSFKNAELKKEGRPPYNPKDLLKLYLYGYQNNIRSSRKLAAACKTNIEVIWMLQNVQPTYKTIADFRKDNKKAFRHVFRHFVSIFKDWKLIEGKTIAVDSVKVRAVNSMKNNFNEKKIERHLKYIDEKIEEYEKQLEKEDKQEKVEGKDSSKEKKEEKVEDKQTKKQTKVEQLQEKIADKKVKKQKYEALKKQLETSGEKQISTTDKAAKAVIFLRKAIQVGYNIQAASDAKNKMLVAIETGDATDINSLSTMTQKVKQNLDLDKFDVIADAGYNSGKQFKECKAQGVTTYVSPKKGSVRKGSDPNYAIDKFEYNKSEDIYTCPQGNKMTTTGKYYDKNKSNSKATYNIKRYSTKACKDCPVKDLCTKSKNGRVIERGEHATLIEENNKNVKDNKEYYRTRQQIIEHQFGTLKRQWHFDHVLLKGKEKVLAETSIIFTAYNLKRAMSVLKFSDLMSKIKAHFLLFLKNIASLNFHKSSQPKYFFAVVKHNSARQKYL